MNEFFENACRTYQQQKQKIRFRFRNFKRLNDDLINIIILKFKFNRRRLTRIFVKIIRTEKKSFFESDLKSSCDRNKRINHDFLNILSEHEKCSENHKRIEVYSSQKKANKF